MSEKAKNDDGPKFDFSKVSRQWRLEFGRSLSEAARAGIVLQRQINADMDDEAVDALLDRQEKALSELETLADKQAQLVTQVLADVPTDWLIADAPDGLDWGDVASLDYIQANKYEAILEQLRTNNIAEDDAKNSAGHSRSRQKRRGR